MTVHQLDQLEAIHKDVKEIKEILLGDGKHVKGVVTRLVLLEAKAKRAMWIVTTAVAALLTAGAEFALGFLRHKG